MAVIDELVALLGFDLKGEENVKKFNDTLEQAAKKANELGEKLGKVTAIAGAAMVGGLSFLGKSVLDVSAQFESLESRFIALEGSSEKAKSALDWVQEFAKKTPLSLSETANAYAQLRTFGIDPTTGALQYATDTMAMAGQGADYLNGIILAMGQAWTKGKLQGEEALQLIERGVPVWELLAQKMGITAEKVQELSSKGKLGRKEMTLLYEAMGERAKGASERYSKTWNGLMARMGDSWEQFQKRIGDAGYFGRAKDVLENIMETLEEWDRDGTMDKAAEAVSRALSQIVGAVAMAANRIRFHMAFLNKHWEAIEPWAKSVGAAFLFLAARAFPLVTIFLAISVAIDDLLAYLSGGESMFGDFVQWLKDVTGLGDGAAQAIAGIGAAIATALGAGLLLSPLKTLGMLLLAPLKALKFARVGALWAGRLALGFTRALVVAGGLIVAGVAKLSRMIVAALTGAAQGLGEGIKKGVAEATSGMQSAGAKAGASYGMSFLSVAKKTIIPLSIMLGEMIDEWNMTPEERLKKSEKSAEGYKKAETALDETGIGKFWKSLQTAPGGGTWADWVGIPALPDGGAIANWLFGGDMPRLAPAGVPGGSSVPLPPIKPEAPQAPQAPGQNHLQMMQTMLQNALSHQEKMDNAAAAITNDNRVSNTNVTVSAPISMTVQQPTQAPAAVAGAVQGAVTKAGQLAPTRLQAGPVQ